MLRNLLKVASKCYCFFNFVFEANFSDFEVEDICVHGNSSHSEVLQVIMTKSEDIDNKIYIMDIKTEEIQVELQGHQAYITSLQVVEQLLPTKDSLIVSTSDDMTCRTWFLSTGKLKNIFKHKSAVTCAHYYPNGTLITGCQSGGIYIWNEFNVELHDFYENYASPVTCIESYQAVDMLLIIGYLDGSIRVWDASSKDCLAALFGHKDRIRALSIMSTTLPKIISCSNDGLVKMWDLDKLIKDYFTTSFFSTEKKRNKKAAYRVDIGNTIEAVGNALPSIDTSLIAESSSRPGTSPKKGSKGANNLERPPSSASKRSPTSKNENDNAETFESNTQEGNEGQQQPVPPSATPPTKKSNSRSNILIESVNDEQGEQGEQNEVNASGAIEKIVSLDDKMKEVIANAKRKTDAINETLVEERVPLQSPTTATSDPPAEKSKKSLLQHATNMVTAVNRFGFGSKKKQAEEMNADTVESSISTAAAITPASASSADNKRYTSVSNRNQEDGNNVADPAKPGMATTSRPL